jgi:hypothetical protein
MLKIKLQQDLITLNCRNTKSGMAGSVVIFDDYDALLCRLAHCFLTDPPVRSRSTRRPAARGGACTEPKLSRQMQLPSSQEVKLDRSLTYTKALLIHSSSKKVGMANSLVHRDSASRVSIVES